METGKEKRRQEGNRHKVNCANGTKYVSTTPAKKDGGEMKPGGGSGDLESS